MRYVARVTGENPNAFSHHDDDGSESKDREQLYSGGDQR